MPQSQSPHIDRLLTCVFVAALLLGGCAFLALSPDSPARQTPPAEDTEVLYPGIVISPTEAAAMPVLPTCPPGSPTPTRTHGPTGVPSPPQLRDPTATVTGTPPTPTPFITPTPRPLFRTIDLAPKVPDEHKRGYFIWRAAGFYEVVIIDSRPQDGVIDVQKLIQVCPGDTIIQALPLAPLISTPPVEPTAPMRLTLTPSPGAPQEYDQ